jgi:hypothetical protein
MLILSVMLTIAGGDTSSAIVIGNVNLVIIGAASGLFLVLQVLVAFVLKSEAEKELFLLRQIALKQLERGIAEDEALDGRIRQEIREGNLPRAPEWDEFRRRRQ